MAAHERACWGFSEHLGAAGANSFVLERVLDVAVLASRFGGSHCLVGSGVDCRDLTFRHRDQVHQALDRTFAALRQCRGAILAVGNHLPPNIPDDMLDLYFGELLPRLRRGA